MRQPGLSHRVVPLWVHGPQPQAQGEVVLPQVPPHVQEKGPVVVTYQPLPIVIMLPKEEVKNEKRRLLKALLTCVCVADVKSRSV